MAAATATLTLLSIAPHLTTGQVLLGAVTSTASVAGAQLANTGGGAVPVRSGAERPTGQPWPVKAVAFIRFGPVVLAGTAAVGLVQVSQEEYSPQRLEAVDLATGHITKGAQVPAGNTVIGYHGDVFVLGPNKVASDGGAIGPYVVRPVRTGTLSLGPAVPVFPSCARCYQLVSAFQPAGRFAGDLWVAGGTGLRLVKPATGQVLTSVGLRGTDIVSVVAVEPDGRYVDVSTRSLARQDRGAKEVLELRTSNGDLVKRLLMPFAIAPPQLVAVPGGIWLSWRGGMAGSANFFPEGSLSAKPYGSSFRSVDGLPFPGADTMMGDWVTSVGGIVVLTNDVGATCVEATGGKVLASSAFGRSQWLPFGGAGRNLYAVSSRPPGGPKNLIVDVRMPAFCGRG